MMRGVRRMPSVGGVMRAPTSAGCLAVLALCMGATPAAAGSDAVSGQLIVGFDKGVSSQRGEALVERLGGRVDRRLARIRASVVRPQARNLGVATLIKRLAKARGVAYAEPDFYLNQSVTPNDPLWPTQYAMAPTGAGAIQAPAAWDASTRCSTVAVLDTGTQSNHPDLQPNVWHNPHEIDDNNKDDDKNGYVDDYFGVNLVAGKGSGEDDEGHGTHVSGIVAGHGNNADGVAGLCWSAAVMPVKFMNSQGKGSTSAAIDGIDYAIGEGAKIINCSFGSSSKSSALQDAVDNAEDKGVLMVIAAGNNGQSIDSKPEYPAAFTNGNIITVAAVTQSGSLASFSNFGAKLVDLGAPGDNIVSTYPPSTYKVLSGTSMATPMVSAAAAMIRHKNTSLTYKQIRSAILSHTTPDGSLSGKVVHPGVLNVAAALAAG
jgi:subtilisin family serine protease